jgi:flagellar assembly factor FliW
MTTAPPLPPATVETRFGTFPVAAADVVHFAHGLPGFESCRQFVLIAAPELLPFTCLHGIDAGPPFLTLDPRQIVAGYTSPLGAAERHRLEAAPESAAVARDRARGRSAITANLRAPIVINPRRMLGLQVMGPTPRGPPITS